MIKYGIDLKLDSRDLSVPLQQELNQVIDIASPQIGDKARSIAKSTLKTSLGIWQKGFVVEQITSGVWVLGMEGELSTMIEDGFTAKKFQDMIFSGNRASVNKAEGKDYVDIPMHQNVNQATGMIGKTKVSVKHFRDANEMAKQFYIKSAGPTPGSGTIAVSPVALKKVQNVISSRPKPQGNTSFLVIKRLTKHSNWPNYKGAKIFESLDYEIERILEDTLYKVMG